MFRKSGVTNGPTLRVATDGRTDTFLLKCEEACNCKKNFGIDQQTHQPKDGPPVVMLKHKKRFNKDANGYKMRGLKKSGR